MMYSEDDLQYAIESTRVILSPERRIDTFGTTSFRFYLVSELMDTVNQIRVRNGSIQADRPQIMTPENATKLSLEGFGEQAQKFLEMLKLRNSPMLKYGFQIRKNDLSESLVHDSLEAVIDRVKAQVPPAELVSSAVIQGVDEAWEVCLLKFTVEMIQRSAGGNIRDFRQKGLL